jgi:hypothetical protein
VWDDDEYLRADRRKHRIAVGLTIAGVLGLIARCAITAHEHAAREQAIEDNMALQRELERLRDRPAPVPIPPIDPGPADHRATSTAPIELEVVAGGERHDVGPEPITLGDGRTLEVTPRSERVFNGPDFSLTYGPEVRVVLVADRHVVMSATTASAELMVVDDGQPDDDVLATMGATYAGTGQVSSDNAVTHHTIGGKPAAGRHLKATTGAQIDLLIAPLPRHRRLVAVVTSLGRDEDTQLLLATLASGVSAQRLKQVPDVDVTLGGDGGAGPVAATLGTAVHLGTPRVDVTVRQRATIRETLGGITFEHDPALTAAVGDLQGFADVQLRGADGEVAIQIMSPPIAMSIADLAHALPGAAQADEREELTRRFGDDTYQGLRFAVSLGELRVENEAFVFTRGGRYFTVLAQSRPGHLDAAERVMAAVIASIQ